VSGPGRPEILVVCTANRVRSPLAAAMLTARCAQRRADVKISSAGMLRGGHPAEPFAVQVGLEHGLDLSRHVSRQVTSELLQRSDLVIAMTRDHLRQLAVVDPSALPRLLTVKDVARSFHRLPPSGLALREAVAAATAARSIGSMLGDAADDDVADPMGGPVEGYRTLVAELGPLLDRIAAALASERLPLHERALPSAMPAPPRVG
jgi:protein-tyrosine phosphatase